MNIFLIFGYGIPEDIKQDKNYVTYLYVAFNKIYEIAAEKDAVIIPCGGPTNCTPPYRGTEAQEIEQFITDHIDQAGLNQITTTWKIIQENTSLSTLENFVFARNIIDVQGLVGDIVIFCEKTREDRIKALAEQVFPQRNWTVEAIDFDTSKNRYLNIQAIKKKEEVATKEGLWTLQDPERMKVHHAFFQKKFDFLRQRQAEGISHEDAVKEWIESEDSFLQEIMPDHPQLRKT